MDDILYSHQYVDDISYSHQYVDDISYSHQYVDDILAQPVELNTNILEMSVQEFFLNLGTRQLSFLTSELNIINNIVQYFFLVVKFLNNTNH